MLYVIHVYHGGRAQGAIAKRLAAELRFSKMLTRFSLVAASDRAANHSGEYLRCACA